MNPLIPNGLDIFITLSGILHILFFTISMYVIGKDKYLSINNKFALIVISFFIVILGPITSIAICNNRCKVQRK